MQSPVKRLAGDIGLEAWMAFALSEPVAYTRMWRQGFAEMVKEADVLIFAFANHDENVFPDGAFFYPVDVGLAFEDLLLAATDLGLVSHPVAAVNQEELKKVQGVPEGERFIIATPLAYPAQGPYDEAAAERRAMSTRKSLSKIVYFDEWGKLF